MRRRTRCTTSSWTSCTSTAADAPARSGSSAPGRNPSSIPSSYGVMPFRLRRFAVALLGLLLVQLSLLGAGVACTVPAVGGPAASAAHGSAAGVAHHAGGHAHDGGDVAGADALPSDDAPPSGH